MTNKHFILASASSGRLALLKRIGFEPDEVIPAHIDESRKKREKPIALASRLAREKALVIAKQKPDSVILAADSVAVAIGIILEKTEDPEVERKYLKLLSGKRHKIHTAICVVHKDKIRQKTVTSIMKFKRFSDAEIEEYIASNEWRGKAGGYSIEERAESFISYMSGSYSNIIGLPLYETRNLLLNFGICQKS